jgi:hypothetical protein
VPNRVIFVTRPSKSCTVCRDLRPQPVVALPRRPEFGRSSSFAPPYYEMSRLIQANRA